MDLNTQKTVKERNFLGRLTTHYTCLLVFLEKGVNVILSRVYTLLSKWVPMAKITGFIRGVANRLHVNERKAAFFGKRLKQVLDLYPDREGVIIYPPTHDWGFMFQRPQQMARAFARRGYLYFYCTKNERSDSVIGYQEVESHLFVCHVPLETFRLVEQPIVYLGAAWYRGKFAYLNSPRIIYDCYDDLEVSGARVEDHENLLATAEMVLVASKRLLDDIQGIRPDAVFVPNAVDYQYIKNSYPKPDREPPADLRSIMDTGHPIIGYSGGLAEWFDYELLAYIAKAKPEMEFVLLGVNYDGSLDRSRILEINNVHWLGMKPYSELFNYLWRFDVGIIPFKINTITLATSPIKLFEYMAAAKPVVTTALPECQRYPGVWVAETYEQFVKHLDSALLSATDDAYLSLIDHVAQENTWDSRVTSILEVLTK